MPTLHVPLDDRAYDITIADGFLAAGDCPGLAAIAADRTCLLVADEHVAPLYAAATEACLRAAGAASVDTITFDPGEASKNMSSVARMCSAGIEAGLDRTSLFVALGGGVTGDMVGFAAACFMRGVDYIQVPTSLVAQVDSSVGGKTGVNIPEGKNLVGAFHQPRLVAVDVACLRSLPARQLQCGLAEVVKYGVIADRAFFDWLEARVPELTAVDADTYAHVVHRSCELKAEVVLADERDLSGRRATLNYGHTFGHALEALAGYGTLTHGEAIAIGMGMAADLALALHPCEALREVVTRQDALFIALGLPTRATGFDPATVQVAMRSDKKYEKGKNRLLLPYSLGDVRLVKNVDEDAILAAIGGRCDPA